MQLQLDLCHRRPFDMCAVWLTAGLFYVVIRHITSGSMCLRHLRRPWIPNEASMSGRSIRKTMMTFNRMRWTKDVYASVCGHNAYAGLFMHTNNIFPIGLVTGVSVKIEDVWPKVCGKAKCPSIANIWHHYHQYAEKKEICQKQETDKRQHTNQVKVGDYKRAMSSWSIHMPHCIYSPLCYILVCVGVDDFRADKVASCCNHRSINHGIMMECNGISAQQPQHVRCWVEPGIRHPAAGMSAIMLMWRRQG